MAITIANVASVTAGLAIVTACFVVPGKGQFLKGMATVVALAVIAALLMSVARNLAG